MPSSFDPQLLLDSVVDYAIYMLDVAGRVVSWNVGAQRLKQYSPEEILGRHFSSFYTPEDREAGVPEHALDTARRTGRFHSEGWRVRKDGSRFFAMVVIDAIRNEAGEVIGFAKITRDITDRFEAHLQILRSETRYRQLVDAVVDYAIFQLDSTGHVTTWNPGAERIKGYTPSEIVGRHFSTFYTEEDRAAGVPQKALQAAAKTGKFEAEGWRVRKDGSKFWALVIIDRIVDENDNIVGFAKVTRDITERYEAQQELKKIQEQLALSQKMEAVGQLSGGIAHDFNNLLMIVIGNLETAQNQAHKIDGHPSLNRALGNAMRGAQRAAALTSRLLAFSRRQALDPKPIDLNKYLASTTEFLQRSLGETVQIEAAGSAGLWMIEADPNQLESALVNLAINARDAMPRGGKITVEAANVIADDDYTRVNPEVMAGQYVVICVTDNGHGMPTEIANRAFEPFFTTKEAGQGTGLGLSQVYGFVKQSGGHVKIYSEPGEGTTVKIYLPRLMRLPDQENDTTIPIFGSNDGETILVVEDDTDLRSYLAEVLRGLGYQVVTCSDAASAKVLLAQTLRPIDLMLTDIVMPGQNGKQLGDEALALRPGLKIIYMTGYSRNAVVHQGRLDAGVDLLQKPISQADLANRIRLVLDRA
ncbi:MAG: PAS domain S-box protein [Sphingomicrobium sp.]